MIHPGWAAAYAQMWGVPMDELESMEVPATGTSDSVDTTRYCVGCWCSQKATGDVPCWFCAGPTTAAKPKNWPGLIGPQVPNGNSFSVTELYEQLELPMEAA